MFSGIDRLLFILENTGKKYNIEKIKSAYESIGAETELVVEEPASIAEVESIENIIERKLAND